MNISWFTAKAYLANIYYTTQRDLSIIIITCDDISHVYRQSQMNQAFAEKMFPVALSTHWTSIYDKEIQQLLGFYSLCFYVLDICSSRSVFLGVCPVQFALYLRLRVVLDQSPWIMYSRVQRYIGDYDEHIDACRCMIMIEAGRFCMQTILRLLLMDIK